MTSQAHPISSLIVSDLYARYSDSKDAPFISKDIHFSLQAGELMAIMGPSGSGKSTLIRGILGLINLKEGSKIYINANDKTSAGLSYVRSQVGMVPQDDVLVDELTIRENLSLFHTVAVDSELSKHELNQRIDCVLNELMIDVEQLADRPLAEPGSHRMNVSGGQRKRINIAMELVNEPDILIVDEPTSGLSSSDSLDVMKYLKEYAKAGRMVIVIIHQPSHKIFDLFDKLLVLNKEGRCVASGQPEPVGRFLTSLDGGIMSEKCSACGHFDTDSLMDAVELIDRKSKDRPDIWDEPIGEFYNSHFLPMARKSNIPSEELGEKRSFRAPVEYLRDFVALAKRQITVKKRDRLNLITTFLAPLVLGLMTAAVFKYSVPGQDYSFSDNKLYNQFLFMMIVSATFLGMINSVMQVIKDRPMIERESLRGLSFTSYYLSAFLVLSAAALLQTTLFLLPASYLLDSFNLLKMNFGVMYLMMVLSIALGLCVSMLSKTAVAAYNLIPVIIIPQIVLGGGFLPYAGMSEEIYLWNKEPNKVPVLAQAMPIRWGYELAVTGNNDSMLFLKPEQSNKLLKEKGELPEGSFLSNLDNSGTVPGWLNSLLGEKQSKTYVADIYILGLMILLLISYGITQLRVPYRYRPIEKKRIKALQGLGVLVTTVLII